MISNPGLWTWYGSFQLFCGWEPSPQPIRVDYGPVYDAEAAKCDAKKDSDEYYCNYSYQSKMLGASERRACMTRASTDYADCLGRAREAQRNSTP